MARTSLQPGTAEYENRRAAIVTEHVEPARLHEESVLRVLAGRSKNFDSAPTTVEPWHFAQPVVVTVDQAGQIVIRKRVVSLADLPNIALQLIESKPNSALFSRSAKEADSDRVEDVRASLQEAGIEVRGVITE